MCNAEQWSAMLDKYHLRKVHEVRVRCWHKDFGCDWVGEVNELKQHDDSCVNQPWECEYCGLKCTYEEGEGKHWPTCLKFPEPCPNMCEVGSVERCNMEQHLSVCPLELVACEMKEFGCSVVVPRKELARHMRESEIQHLTAMTVMNLRLTRQLQQDSTEMDRKIAQLQQEVADQQTETSMKIEQLQLETKRVLTTLERNMDALSLKVTDTQLTTRHIEHHVIGECSGSEVFTFTEYWERKGSNEDVDSDPFYSHYHGYKFKLRISYNDDGIGSELLLLTGLFDDELTWPMWVKVRLEIRNQYEDHHDVVKGNTLYWGKHARGSSQVIDDHMIRYYTLERRGGGIQYMKNDCLEFKIIVEIL